MAKKLSKSAKLDLIVTELAKVKTELKKLSKQHTALASELNRRIRPATPARKPQRKTSQKTPAPAAKAAPLRETAAKRPVLIQSPEAPPAAGRAS